jgi:hypothetical protein
MTIEKWILILSSLGSLILVVWKGVQLLIALMDETNNSRTPRIWRFHNRLIGWTAVLSMLLFSMMAYRNFLYDAGTVYKVINLAGALFALCVAPVFAIFQHRIWVNEGYGRFARVGPLEGSL